MYKVGFVLTTQFYPSYTSLYILGTSTCFYLHEVAKIIYLKYNFISSIFMILYVGKKF